jgi:SAM-dependent methyltransferase/uncharacterized protein YbaR (Trm112 family)
LHNQVGEIAFRRKLSNNTISKYLPSESELINILKKRNSDSQKTFLELGKSIPLSPFLELGAERACRSALLVSKLASSGFALDLSLDSLFKARYFASKLNLKSLPILVCADAYNLPFKARSIPFVFCFETLHHFPHPKPIIDECLRVTKNNFYFSEEPIRQLLNLRLWRRDYHLNLFEKLLKKIYLLPFLSDIGRSEVKNNILENSFWLDIWKQSLPPDSSIELQPIFWGPKSYSLNPSLLNKVLLAIQGGGITALVTKNTHRTTTHDLLSLLSCPTCHISLNLNSLQCSRCKQKFIHKNGVYILLKEPLRKKLYGF